MKHLLSTLIFVLSMMACGCGSGAQKRTTATTQTPSSSHKYYTFRTIAELPHSTSDYTQGFQFADGVFWEGTGGYGPSALKRYEPYGGASQKEISLPRIYFGEGITLLGEEIFQLTWRKGKAFVYDKQSLRKLREHNYDGEGWGLTTDGQVLYMSDGSNILTVRDPKTFKPLRTIAVTFGGRKVYQLNELEWIDGEIWANVYMTDTIVRIDPTSGNIVGVIDLTGLQSPLDVTYDTDVLNGIAHDPATGRIWLTGKNWNKIYQVEIIEK